MYKILFYFFIKVYYFYSGVKLIMIECKQLCFGYIKKPFCIKDLNLNIKKGERIAVLGGEGMGKTSLLRVLSGLENLYAGCVCFNNKDVREIELKDRGVSYLPSIPVFFENKSIKKNIEYLLNVEDIQNFSEDDLKGVFNKFSFNYDINIKVKKLPLVDKKILSVIRAFIKKSKYVFIDDFFEGEECSVFNKLNNALNVLFDENKPTVVFVYNKNNNLVFNKYLYLSYGNNFEFKSLNEIKNSYVDYFVSNYFDFHKNEFVLTKKDEDYFICDFNSKKNKKRKNEEIVVKNAYKISKNNNKYLKKLDVMENEIIRIDVLSDNFKFENVNEKILNEALKEESIHLFEHGTGVKIL